VDYLLANKAHFFEVAYFYQFVSSNRSVPFLDSDTSDLIENCLAHIEPLPELGRDSAHEREAPANLLHKMVGTALKVK
jgi:hypothetical protein